MVVQSISVHDGLESLTLRYGCQFRRSSGKTWEEWNTVGAERLEVMLRPGTVIEWHNPQADEG